MPATGVIVVVTEEALQRNPGDRHWQPQTSYPIWGFASHPHRADLGLAGGMCQLFRDWHRSRSLHGQRTHSRPTKSPYAKDLRRRNRVVARNVQRLLRTPALRGGQSATMAAFRPPPNA